MTLRRMVVARWLGTVAVIATVTLAVTLDAQSGRKKSKGAEAPEPTRVTSSDSRVAPRGIRGTSGHEDGVALQGSEVAVPGPEERQRPHG